MYRITNYNLTNSFEQFQPFFIYFDKEGISFFPLDMNNKYNIIGKSFISWNDLKRFNFKKGLIMEYGRWNTITTKKWQNRNENKLSRTKMFENSYF